MFSVYLPTRGSDGDGNEGRPTDLPCINVLILKPNVGLTDNTSSLLIFLRIVVFPALSNPLRTMSVS